MRSIFFGARKSASHRPEFRLVQLTPVGVTSRQDYGHHAARGGDLCSLALQQAMKAFKLQMCLGQWGMEAPRHPWSPMKMMNMMNMMKTDEKWSNMVKWCMCRWSKSRSLTHGEKARERESESESATDFAWFSGMICILCTCRWCAHSEKMYWRDGVAILPQPAKWRKHGTESLRIVHEPTAEEWLGSRSFDWFDGQPGKKSEYVRILY